MYNGPNSKISTYGSYYCIVAAYHINSDNGWQRVYKIYVCGEHMQSGTQPLLHCHKLVHVHVHVQHNYRTVGLTLPGIATADTTNQAVESLLTDGAIELIVNPIQWLAASHGHLKLQRGTQLVTQICTYTCRCSNAQDS